MLWLDRRGIEFGAEHEECVRDRIRDGGRRCNSATFANALDAQRIERRREFLMEQLHSRAVARARQRIIHQRSGQQLALLIVDELFEQGATQALDRAADDLPLDQQRIDTTPQSCATTYWSIPI